jgi:GNAT superfamily N-acetyltransferase
MTIDDDQFAIASAEQRPDLIPAFAELATPVWPSFIAGDRAIVDHWDRLFCIGLARFQFLVLRVTRSGAEQVVATSNSVPFFWAHPDDDASLPDDGWDAVLTAGVEAFAAGRTANALSALSIVVAPEMRGSAVAERLLLNMKDCARHTGFEALVAPVRPTRKPAYPLTAFEDYLGWTSDGGDAPFDPWVRKHVQLGARIVKVAPRSMTVTAPLSRWTAWTGIRFPVSGGYHLPGGLAPLAVDCSTGTGLYEEPNVWMRHPLRP